MARKFKLFGTEIAIGKRLFGLGKDETYWGEMTSFGTDLKAYSRLDSYQGIVYACINLIAESVASYDPHIYRKKGDQWEDIGDHEFLQLLHRPGGTDEKAIPVSMFDLLYATWAFIELQGDCYWYMAKGVVSGKPREIVILRADKVGRHLDKDTGDIDYFFVRSFTGQEIRIEIDEMLPFIGFNPRDPYSGIGTTEAAREYIQTDDFAMRFTKNFFRNNAGINGILSLKGSVIQTAFRKFVRQWRSRYEGVDNAGKTAIIRDTEAAFTKVGLGLNELDMSALRKMSRDDISMMYRVPMPLLGKAEESGLGRANVESLEYIFAKYNITPKMNKLDAVLQFALDRYYGPGLFIEHADIIPADKEFELSKREKSVDKWVTRNEIRDEDGFDDIDGGDQLFVPINNIPIDQTSLALEDDPEEETDDDTGKIVIRRITKGGATPTKKKDHDVNKEQFRLTLMRRQTLYERRYRQKVSPILKEQLKEALFNLEAKASGLTKDFNEKLFDDILADALMVEKLSPVLTLLGEEQGALALLFAGDEESDFRLNANYKAYVTRSTKRMAQNFNDETLKRLNSTLAEGIQEGEALDKLKRRVESVYEQASGTRALRIARTETLKASNTATNEAYKQTGYVKAKEWYVNPDGCPQCAEFNGKTVDLDDNFLALGQEYTWTDQDGEEHIEVNSYDTVEQPPLHPNCRCTIMPVS